MLGNTAPDGGYALLNDNQTIPVWMQSAGYHTVHIGKMPNGYGEFDRTYVPPGWRAPLGEFYGFVPDPPSAYYGFKLNENGTVKQYEATDYQTDVYAQKANEAINDNLAMRPDTPLFMMLQFFAPHDPAAPAARHDGLFSRLPLPDTGKSFNEKDVGDKPFWLRQTRRMGGGLIQKVTNRYRSRLESLLAVDEAVQSIVNNLFVKGILDNTYIVFTSDNGFMQGQHRLHQGKFVAYDESSKVPLLIRGPGIPAGTVSSELVSNVDLVPTLVEAGQAAAGVTMDGRSLLPYARDGALRTKRPILLETGQGDRPRRPGERQRRRREEGAHQGLRQELRPRPHRAALGQGDQAAQVPRDPHKPLPADQVLGRGPRALRHGRGPRAGRLGLQGLPLHAGRQVPAEEAGEADPVRRLPLQRRDPEAAEAAQGAQAEEPEAGEEAEPIGSSAASVKRSETRGQV